MHTRLQLSRLFTHTHSWHPSTSVPSYVQLQCSTQYVPFHRLKQCHIVNTDTLIIRMRHYVLIYAVTFFHAVRAVPQQTICIIEPKLLWQHVWCYEKQLEVNDWNKLYFGSVLFSRTHLSIRNFHWKVKFDPENPDLYMAQLTIFTF